MRIKTTEILDRIRAAQKSLEELREDLSTELYSRRATSSAPDSDLARIADLHHRVSTALAALHGEIRDH